MLQRLRQRGVSIAAGGRRFYDTLDGGLMLVRLFSREKKYKGYRKAVASSK